MNKNGFTLTEVLATVAIIGIISLIAVPSVLMISSSIKERIFESQKTSLVSAAELYAKDNTNAYGTSIEGVSACQDVGADEACVQVRTLLNENYAEADTNKNGTNCTEEIGCIINPVDKTSLNDSWVLVRRKSNGSIGLWMGTPSGTVTTTEETLVKRICDGFLDGTYIGKDGTGSDDTCNCGDLEADSVEDGYACLITGNNEKNYVRYPNGSGNDAIWRIMGVYKVDRKLSAKMITDENIALAE